MHTILYFLPQKTCVSATFSQTIPQLKFINTQIFTCNKTTSERVNLAIKNVIIYNHTNSKVFPAILILLLIGGEIVKLVLLIIMTLFMSAGCSINSKDTSPQVDVVPEKENIKSIDVAGNLVNEITFRDGKGSGGEITDNVNINSIDFKKEDNAEHIIIGFSQRNEGSIEEPQLVAPDFNVKVQESPYTMTFTINGARAFDANDFKELKKSDLVVDAYWVFTPDDSAERLVVVFRSPARFEVREFADPAQVVVSFVSDELNDESAVYSVRTDADNFGGNLANLEEIMHKEEGIRYLRENGSSFTTKEGSFYLELGVYETYNDAERRVEGINGKYGPNIKVFIEER